MRPIDADELLQVPNVRKVDEFDETGESISYLAVPVEAINNATTIEAEPVVHCKDCKNFKEYTPEFKKSAECVEGADGDCITRALYSDAHPQFSAVRKCDYCSLGAKMDLEG